MRVDSAQETPPSISRSCLLERPEGSTNRGEETG